MKKERWFRKMMSVVLCSTMLVQGTVIAQAEEEVAGKVTLDQQSVELEGVPNARQLGGYIGADGRKVKDLLLLRTGSLSKVSDEAASRLSDVYDVTHIIDFRMKNERDAEPDKMIRGAENTWISVLEFDMTDPAIQQMMKNMAQHHGDPIGQMIEYAKMPQTETLYQDILMSESGQKGYAQFFDILLNNEDGAVVWHCTHGKDRTGIAAGLLLHALGVDESVIEQDFMLSEEAYQKQVAYIEAEARKRGCDEKTVANAKILAGVSLEMYTGAMAAVEAEYGSLDAYIENQLGVSQEELVKLRDIYLEAPQNESTK